MMRVGAIAAATCVLVLACGKDKEETHKLHRSGEGPAVVVIGGPSEAPGLAAEAEPNDAEPQSLELGAGVQGVLNGADDVDRYTVVLTERGMLFALAKGAADADLIVELLDADAKSLATSDRGPAKTSEGVAGMSLEPGTYQIVVKEFTKKKLRKSGGRKGVSEPYQLRASVQTSAEASYELEDNADSAGASEILAGEERYGYVGWQGDEDLWRLPVHGFDSIEIASDNGTESRPALNIVFSAVPGLQTRLRLMTSDGVTILERTSAKGNEVAIRNLVPDVAAEAYLVQVSSTRSNPEEPYVLRVEESQIVAGSEEEPNDSLETATPLQGAAGTLILASGEVSLGDVDVFSLPPSSEERIMEVELSVPGDAKLDLSVLAESGAVLGTVQSVERGGSLRLTSIPVMPNVAPAIRVQPSELKGPASYKLTLSLVEGHAPPPAIAPAPFGAPSE